MSGEFARMYFIILRLAANGIRFQDAINNEQKRSPFPASYTKCSLPLIRTIVDLIVFFHRIRWKGSFPQYYSPSTSSSPGGLAEPYSSTAAHILVEPTEILSDEFPSRESRKVGEVFSSHDPRIHDLVGQVVAQAGRLLFRLFILMPVGSPSVGTHNVFVRVIERKAA